MAMNADNEYLLSLVSNLAIVLTLGSFLSPIPICTKIYKKKATGDVSAVPFLAGSLSTSLWLRYGLYVRDPNVVFINMIGAFCFCSFVLFFYVYTLHKPMMKRRIGITVALFLAAYIACASVKDPIFISGLVASSSGVFFTASPLLSVFDVIKIKSTENLPFPLIMSNFLVCLTWFVYARLKEDVFIQVPNFLGASFAMLQLSLFVVYPYKKSISDIESDQLIHEKMLI